MKEIEKLLNLEGYKIIRIEERSEKKEMKKIIYLESRNKKQKCPECGEFTNSVHDKLKPIELKYLKIGEYNSKINIVKKRFICHKCKKKFTEEISLNNKGKTISNKYAFIVNDPIHRKALDILPERKKEYLIKYFGYCENRHSVEFVISDMYEPYLLVQQIMFPKAKYVVDRFHYTRYVMDGLDKVRIRLQKEYGYNSKEYRMLKNKKNITLLRKYSNDIDWWTYTRRYKNKHQVEILKHDVREELLNINEELKKAYLLKELFFDVLHTTNYEYAEIELKEWITIVRNYNIEEMVEASKTIENWLPYIVNSFIDERFSNGFTEGLNNKIKVIKRVGFGYRNFDFFRLRVMYILNGKISGKSKKDRNRKK